MKKIIKIITITISIIIFPNLIYADSDLNTQQILKQQESNFGVREFLKETEQYTPDFMKDIDIEETFSTAIKGKIDNLSLFKRIIKLFTLQITETIKILINILIIVLIHSILKAVTEELENNNISKIVYYVQYILIVTLIMANFSQIISDVEETIENLVGFSRNLIPLLITLMIYTGNIATSTLIEPILLFLIQFIANLIKGLIIPVISIITVLAIVSKISNKIQITKLSNLMKSGIVWFLGIALTLFIGVLSLEGSLTSSVDGITAKTTKAAVSSLIPVVRKNIRRWCRCGFRLWSDTKKCYWNSWSYNNYWNMYSTYNKTRHIYGNVCFSIKCNRAISR